MKNIVLPRVILGNRGDVASRWGVLRALHTLGVENATVFCHTPADVPPLPYRALAYRPLMNLLQDRTSWRALREADTALWAVGLDMQDDSSLARLMYLWTAFRLYRLLGLRIITLFQGAGPLTTDPGKALARGVLAQVDTFVARDPGTYNLIGRMNPGTRRLLAHDACFLPGFEEDAMALDEAERGRLQALFGDTQRPVIGLNIRQWFHFSSSLLPYQVSKKAFLERSLPKMAELINKTAWLAGALRRELGARILLISAYQPGIVPWEDDLNWLTQVKARFADDDEVILTNFPMTMPAYYALMSRLSLMIGMRLHSSLIALRFGMPGMNLSYTLKGGDIMKHLGLPENVVDLNGFLESPQPAFERAATILAHLPAERERVRLAVQKAIETNMSVLQNLLTGNLE